MYKGDPYKYNDVNVLINKLNIKNDDILERFERDITVRRIAIVDDVMHGEFNYQRLLDTHKYIFGHIYEWAGCERVIQMTKGERVLGGDTVRYSYPNNIEREAKKAIEKLNKVDWSTLNEDDRPMKFAERIAELWQVHPFREGNTRTVVTYAIQFANEHGFPMNKQILQEHSAYVRDSLVKASDGQYSEYHYLADIFKDAINNHPLKKKAKIKNTENEYEYER